MNDQTDSQLLRAYAEHRSEQAFTELVRRHLDIVHSAALRMVCDSHLAQDVTQGVFVALARNAAQLKDRPVLSGWLHRTAQNIAAQTVRTDVRRRVREQEAAAMNELLSAEPDVVWEHIAPHLDSALGELSEPDRDALMLRYFERKSAGEMATTLGISGEAAQKRVSRAVERLREFFAKRGITVGASGLVVVISANAVQAAPVGLAVTISTAALLAGTTISTTVTATAIKTIAMTTLQKTLITAGLAVAVGAGIYEAHQASKLREQVQTLQQQQAPIAEQIEQLQHERDDATTRLAALREESERLNRNTAELMKLRSEAGSLRGQASELEKLREEKRQTNLGLAAAQNRLAQSPAGAYVRHQIDTVNAMRQLGLAMRVYALDNDHKFATNFDHLTNELDHVTKFEGDIDLDVFELVNVGLLTDTNTVPKFILRERIPRRTPDGKWERVYCLSDGSVQTRKSDDGSFDADEKWGIVRQSKGD
ncbi:MAG: sigma-70 family RNA polymerase sigma factor [Verrucomicrobia bacterium]|nr:sigma-70 family RNA polymerase sigma factor [Verrucomicrobiota bacterium]